MTPEILSFSTKEALELVQSHNPKQWLLDIEKPIYKIINYTRVHQISLTEAQDSIIATNYHMADNIFTMAAYQHIMNKKIETYGEVLDQINSINNQMLYAQNSNITSGKEKAELMDYYQDKLQALEAQRKHLLKQPEVCKELEVRYKEVSSNQKTTNL